MSNFAITNFAITDFPATNSGNSDYSGSGLSRRALLRNLAISATIGGLDPLLAQHVHTMAAEDKAATGTYQPKVFTDHEYKTMQRLADLIIPADDRSPGALAAGAADWVDLMSSQNEELADIFRGGILWMDGQIRDRHGMDFLEMPADAQEQILSLIAYRENATNHPEFRPGIRFFDWARKMVVDAYYTSPIGIKELGYMGNKGMSEFKIPQEVIDYALKRSPV